MLIEGELDLGDRNGNFGNGKRVMFEISEEDLDNSLENRNLYVMLVEVYRRDQ